MARGIILPLQTIVIIIMVLIALLIMTLYLSGSSSRLFGKLTTMRGEAEDVALQKAAEVGQDTDLTPAEAVGAAVQQGGWGAECLENGHCESGMDCKNGKCVSR